MSLLHLIEMIIKYLSNIRVYRGTENFCIIITNYHSCDINKLSECLKFLHGKSENINSFLKNSFSIIGVNGCKWQRKTNYKKTT